MLLFLKKKNQIANGACNYDSIADSIELVNYKQLIIHLYFQLFTKPRIHSWKKISSKNAVFSSYINLL